MTTLTPTNLRDFPAVDVNIERPSTLSQTLLAKHNYCPRSAYLSRKYKTGSVPMDRGIALHETLERAVQTMLDQGEPSMPGDVARELADAVMAERTDLVLPTEEQDAVRLMAWNWAEGTVLDLDAIVGIEVPLELELGGFKLTCRIDRIEIQGNTLHLYDYKTSLNIRKREDVQRGFQGQFYALAALHGVRPDTQLGIGAGIEDVWFWEVYPRYRDRESGGLVMKDGSWLRSELSEFRVSLERNIATFGESLETGKWPARDDPSWCGECPAQSECPIPEHLRAIPEITSVEDAQDAFSHKLALDREGRRLQAGMRGWVKENGPIFVGDHVFDATHSESRVVRDWHEFMLVLHRVADYKLPIEISDYVELRQSTKFAKRKITEEERDAGQG